MPSEVLFPHLSSTGPAPSHHEVLLTYRRVFAARAAEGALHPFIIPYNIYGMLAIVLYLCIPHKNHPVVYAARWLGVVGVGWFQWNLFKNTSSESPAVAFVGGFVNVWYIGWAVIWLLMYKPQWEARRAQRRPRSEAADKQNPDPVQKQKISMEHSLANGKPAKEDGGTTEANGLRKRISVKQKIEDTSTIAAPVEDQYYWQTYPDNISERLDWVIDLIANFRYPGWANYAIAPLPPIPEHLNLQTPPTVTKPSLRYYKTRRDLFTAYALRLAFDYLATDFAKVMAMKDPYFVFGPTTYALPSYLSSLTPLQLMMYRLSFTAIAIYVILDLTFFMGHILLCLILGSFVSNQRLEPWYYNTIWGPLSAVTKHGLNGVWGTVWHQTFRFAFAAPTNFLIEKGILKPRSVATKICGLIFAFGISGILHAGGSKTQLAKTRPQDLLYYFLLQGLGILLQSTFCKTFRSTITKMPMLLRQLGNAAFALMWLYSTSWLLADDFARGGVWLIEPLPISPLRALGFGVKGDSWWCWDYGLGWYSGKHWWQSGIAF